jgi:hypothetical protein
MVNFGKLASTASHAIGDVGTHIGSKIEKVGTRKGFLGALSLSASGAVGVGLYTWVSKNGNTVLIAGAVVALVVLRQR